MTISMIRGYAPPPSEGGVAYQQYSQYGYTYITQEGEGHSEPDAGSFKPIPRMDAYRAYTGPRLNTPGPLGGVNGYGCSCPPAPSMGIYYADAGGSGATGPYQTIGPDGKEVTVVPRTGPGIGAGIVIGLVLFSLLTGGSNK